LGDRAAADRLPDRDPGAGPVRPDDGRARHAGLFADQAAGELRRRDELRDLSHVLRLLGALSAVARAGGEPASLRHLPAKHLYPHATEPIRFALYAKMNWVALAVVCGFLAAFMVGAILAYDPSRGFIARRGGPGGET